MRDVRNPTILETPIALAIGIIPVGAFVLLLEVMLKELEDAAEGEAEYGLGHYTHTDLRAPLRPVPARRSGGLLLPLREHALCLHLLGRSRRFLS